MKASIVELRTKMKDITRALARNEAVDIFSHGKVISKMIPVQSLQKRRSKEKKLVTRHTFFGSILSEKESVDDVMDKLRKSRY